MADTPATGWVASRLATAGVGAALTALAAWIALRNLGLPTRDGWVSGCLLLFGSSP
jgi:hypothetical protein